MWKRSVSSLAILAFLFPFPALAVDPSTAAIIYGAKRFLKSDPAPLEKPVPGRAGGEYADGRINSGFKVAFSPSEKGTALRLSAIGDAKKSILVSAGVFSSKEVAKALIRALDRGVHVMVVASARENGKSGSVLGMLARAGVPVKVNGKYSGFGHRFMVVDGKGLEIGGFGLMAASGKKEAAGAVFFENAGELARAYAREWKKLWDEGVTVIPASDKGLSVGAPFLRGH